MTGLQITSRRFARGAIWLLFLALTITCVQTDGLGRDSWFRGGHGEIPYAWETADGISMELFPVLLELFYETSTPNDYFLAIHVRENSDVSRVQRILDGLGSDVEVVPMDVFMKLASARPSFRTHYLR